MSTNEGMALAGLGIFFVILIGIAFLVALVMIIINFVSMWKLFEKAVLVVQLRDGIAGGQYLHLLMEIAGIKPFLQRVQSAGN